MKQIIQKWPVLILAIIVTASFAFVAAAKTKTSQTTSYYKYVGPLTDPSVDLSDYQVVGNWEVSSPEEASCNEGYYPCLVASSETDKADFVNSINTENDIRSIEVGEQH